MEYLTENLEPNSTLGVRDIAILGTYLPRRCGIATFTSDLAEALEKNEVNVSVSAIAMSDRPDYIYPKKVRHQITDSERGAYAKASNWINQEGFNILSVQHEYGIFGGESGRYLLELVRDAKMPIVTTLHTVLSDPSPSQSEVLNELLQLSERVIVMSHKAVGYLVDIHGVDLEKIDHIPHGIPKIPRDPQGHFRATLNIEGPMILTFGLLSPDKGIQYVIEAMPNIIEEYPGAVYVVLGATHPNIKASSGESYRESLIALSKSLGVSENVRFIDQFVPLSELVKYLSAMDIYITPYLNPKQITSGTLAYSVGAGKAVISTPYAYAQELLADERGLMVPFRDSDAIAKAILQIQADPIATAKMGAAAAEFGKNMLWPKVAQRYLESFARAKTDSEDRLSALIKTPSLVVKNIEALPIVKLDHLKVLSDDTGILQHSTFSVPNRAEGYCVDDNCRALLLTALLEAQAPLAPDVSLLQSRYLGFMLDAFNPDNGRFRNFMAYDRTWLETKGSEDSHGRSMWCLASFVARCRDWSRKEAAKATFIQGVGAFNSTTSPRTWAYGAIAAYEFLKAFPGNLIVKQLLKSLSEKLWRCYQINQGENWSWYEQSLTYANARIPQALILAGQTLQNDDLTQVGLKSLSWLMEIQTDSSGFFGPIGSNGFLIRGQKKAEFDQQPIEAAASVSACLSAYQATGEQHWLNEAQRSFRWFLGENALGVQVFEAQTGGCHDGLHADRINRNQGAESTLSYLSALVELRTVSTSLIPTKESTAYEVK